MSNATLTLTDEIDAKVVLDVLAQVRGGDFTARMPLDWTGVPGKVADGLNDVIIANQALEEELARVSDLVGRQGPALPAARARGAEAELVWQRRVGQQPDRSPGATDERDAARHRRRRRR